MKEVVELSKKDREMLFAMDFDARVSYSDLAHKIDLSKQVIDYKIERLLKKGVIKDFYPVINAPRLGYRYCRLLLTLQNVTKEKKDEIVLYLYNHEKVFWLIKTQGMYDLIFATWMRSIREFKEFIYELEDAFGAYIKRKVETIGTEVIHYPNRFLLSTSSTKEIHISETEERAEIDELDRKILRSLCKDARTSYVDIGKKLKESPKVIAYRIKKMEQMKVIEGYRPNIDHNKIGYTHYKVFLTLNTFSKKELNAVKDYLRNNPLVIYVVEGIGLPADLDIEIMIRSPEQLYGFIDDIRFKFPMLIGEYDTLIFLDTLKLKYLPF